MRYRAFLFLILAIQILAALAVPKSVSWDPSYGMVAAQQYVHGRSPNLYSTCEADGDDLTRDHIWRVAYWTPSYQLIPWLLRFGTLSWGVALKLTVAISLTAGFAGWWMWFRSVLGSDRAAAWLLLAMACTRYTWMHTLVYAGGDLLLWSAAPWLVLLNHRALSSRAPLAFLAGAAASGVLMVKYSGIFLGVGLGAAWLWETFRKRVPLPRLLAWIAGAGAAAAVMQLAGFPGGGHAAEGLRVGARTLHSILTPGLLASGVTDLEPMFFGALHLAGLGASEERAAALGLALVILLGSLFIWLKPRGYTLTTIERIGMAAACADIACLTAAVFAGGNIGLQARLGRVAGLLLLPVITRMIVSSTRESAARRTAAIALCIGFLVVPALYGTLSSMPKLLRGARAETDRYGVANTAITATPKAFFAELDSQLPAPDTALLVVQPAFAFPIPERRVIIFDAALTLSLEGLSRITIHGRPPGGVALLLPSSISGSDRLIAVQRTFADVNSWHSIPFATDPAWTLWKSSD